MSEKQFKPSRWPTRPTVRLRRPRANNLSRTGQARAGRPGLFRRGGLRRARLLWQGAAGGRFRRARRNRIQSRAGKIRSSLCSGKKERGCPCARPEDRFHRSDPGGYRRGGAPRQSPCRPKPALPAQTAKKGLLEALALRLSGMMTR